MPAQEKGSAEEARDTACSWPSRGAAEAPPFPAAGEGCLAVARLRAICSDSFSGGCTMKKASHGLDRTGGVGQMAECPAALVDRAQRPPPALSSGLDGHRVTGLSSAFLKKVSGI